MRCMHQPPYPCTAVLRYRCTAAVIRQIDNAQSLFNLPYFPDPLIDQVRMGGASHALCCMLYTKYIGVWLHACARHCMCS